MKINDFIKETSLKWNNCRNTPLCVDIVVLQGRYSEDERSNAIIWGARLNRENAS